MSCHIMVYNVRLHCITSSYTDIDCILLSLSLLLLLLWFSLLCDILSPKGGRLAAPDDRCLHRASDHLLGQSMSMICLALLLLLSLLVVVVVVAVCRSDILRHRLNGYRWDRWCHTRQSCKTVEASGCSTAHGRSGKYAQWERCAAYETCDGTRDIARHRLNGYFDQRVGNICLASSSREWLIYAVLKCMFPWSARDPFI